VLVTCTAANDSSTGGVELTGGPTSRGHVAGCMAPEVVTAEVLKFLRDGPD